VASEELKIDKVKGTDNIADALTKHVGVEDMKMHMEGVGLEHRSGRRRLMPEVAKSGDNEKRVVMGTAEREDEDDEYLDVISFGCSENKGLEPAHCEAKYSQFIGIFSSKLATVPRGGNRSKSCLNSEASNEYFARGKD